MEKRKKGMQDIDVTKKDGANKLSDSTLEGASGGIVFHTLGHYFTRDHDYKFDPSTGKVSGYRVFREFKNRDEAVQYDIKHGGYGQIYKGIF